MTSPQPPAWMITPREEVRTLNGVPTNGWVGYAYLENIRYWADNRRTEAALARHRRNLRVTRLTDDQIYNYLKDDVDLQIGYLGEDICRNGLRTPLVLDYNQQLLDGNRRYLAHRWIADNGSPEQQDFHRRVPVWVLAEEESDERGRMRVITQYNFLTDFRQQWSDLVKAKLLYEQFTDPRSPYEFDELFERYGGAGFTRAKIREFVRTYELVAMYMETCPNEDEALATADEHFIWFQQLQRSYSELIRNDDEFRETIYRNIREGRIGKTDDLKNLKDMVENVPEAWANFSRGNVRHAHHLRRVSAHDREQQAAPDNLVSEINSRLETLLNQPGTVERASPELRNRFQDLAERVPGQVSNVEARLQVITRQLRELTSREMASVSPEILWELEQAWRDVKRQTGFERQ